jgi:malate permease and related proteins
VLTLSLLLAIKLLPVYFIILLGYIANLHLKIHKDGLAKLLIYVLLPVISFTGVMNSELTPQLLSIPFIAFALCCLVCFILYSLGTFLWKDATNNVLSAGIANGNFGFVGIPLTIALLGVEKVSLAAVFGIGGAVFLATVGAYVTARGKYSVKTSISKVFHIPTMYTFALAIVLKLMHVELGAVLTDASASFNAAYSVLGLLLIGIVLSELKKSKIDIKLIAFCLIGAFVLWPLVAISFVLLDKNILHFYSVEVHQLILLMSLVPIGASIVGFATELKVEPDKASLGVVISTLASLVFIPFAITLLTTLGLF